MDYMLNINGNHDCNNYLFAYIFLKNLPPPIRRHVSRMSWSDVYELAAEADKVHISDSDFSTAPIDALQQDGSSEEENALYEVQRTQRRHSSTRTTQRRETQSPRPRFQERTRDLCYFRQTFGNNARRCRSPCAWQAGNARRGGRRQ